MPFRHILKMTATIVGGSSIVVLLGWWLGGEYAADRMHRRGSEIQSVQTAALHRRAKTIQVGQPLPSIDVWSVTGEQSYNVHDLLPDGGIILLVTTQCDLCLENAEQLIANKVVAGCQHVESIIIADRALGLIGFVQELRSRGVFTPVYCDAPEILRRIHEVAPVSTYFILDTGSIVLDFGAGIPSVETLNTYFTSKQSSQS